MNKGFLEGDVKLYIGDEPIAFNNEPVSLEFSVPDDRPLGHILGVDMGSEDGDKGAFSVWDKYTGSIEISLSLQDEKNSLGRWWKQMREQFHRDYKAMLYAVTHHYVVRILCQDDDGNDGYFELTKPSEIRGFYKMVHFIPRFKIYDSDGFPYVIKKGRIKRMKTWPLSQEELEAYSRKLESYKNEKEIG